MKPMGRGGQLRLFALAAVLALCAARCPTAPGQAQVEFTVSATAAGTGPPAIGVNAGHNYDPSWVAWLQRLGVSGLRVFGLAGSLTTLEAFVGASYGSDLYGDPVTSYATFDAAIATLRTPAGHAPGASWPNPPRWATHEAMLNATSVAPDGNSMLNVVAAAQAVGVEPLLVFWMGCGVFQFSTLDRTNSTYWAERWELYKHQYVAARWAFNHGVRKLEF